MVEDKGRTKEKPIRGNDMYLALYGDKCEFFIS
jgi:hypothetical protein